MIESIVNKIRTLIKMGYSVTHRSDVEDYPIQSVSYLGKQGKAVIGMPYGMSANIPENYLGLILSGNGLPENRFFLPFSLTNRVKFLLPGEVALFNPITRFFTHIIFKDTGTIDIVAPVVDITANTNIVGNINITGNVTMIGNFNLVGNIIVTGGDVIADGISLKTHTHAQGSDSNSDTQAETEAPS